MGQVSDHFASFRDNRLLLLLLLTLLHCVKLACHVATSGSFLLLFITLICPMLCLQCGDCLIVVESAGHFTASTCTTHTVCSYTRGSGWMECSVLARRPTLPIVDIRAGVSATATTMMTFPLPATTTWRQWHLVSGDVTLQAACVNHLPTVLCVMGILTHSDSNDGVSECVRFNVPLHT